MAGHKPLPRARMPVAKRIRSTGSAASAAPSNAEYDAMHGSIVDLLQAARIAAARSVNALMTVSYWEIGHRIVEAEQKGRRKADYGEVLIKRLAADLTARFGRGFGWRNLFQMRAFYLAWPGILQTPSAISGHATPENLAALAHHFPLPWSAYVRLLSVKDAQARGFYEAEALRGGWSVRQLDRQIGSQFWERTALSRDKAALLAREGTPRPEDALGTDAAIKDPYVLEFLDLKDEYSESELEDALIHRLQDFLLELGDDFAFIGRQKRLRIDDSWFRVDLLFFHRRLRCLVIIDLKVGRFSYADAGQMHLYLNYAKANWMQEGENPPVGLILCSEKGAAEARYALEGLPNKVMAAEYRTMLPSEAQIAHELAQTTRRLAAAGHKV